jgi:hypothetical protein
MRRIWIVIGWTGEHDEYREWMYKAYEDEAIATGEAERLNDRLRRLGLFNGGDFETWTSKSSVAVKEMREIDPKVDCEYTGTEYRVMGPVGLVTK